MQDKKPKRISWAFIFQSILGIFNLERGLFYTIRGLCIRPGEILRTYLFEDRSKLTKPFAFFIFTTTLAVIISINLDPFSSQMASGELFKQENTQINGVSADSLLDKKSIDLDSLALSQDSIINMGVVDTLVSPDGGEKSDPKTPEDFNRIMAEIYQKYFAKYMQVIYWGLLPFIALFSHLFFKRQKWFYPEHFVLNTYLAGFQNLIYVILVPLLMAFGGNVIYIVYFIIAVGYQVFAYGQLFEKYSKGSVFWRTIVSYMLTFVLFTLVFSIILGVAVGYYIAKIDSTA